MGSAGGKRRMGIPLVGDLWGGGPMRGGRWDSQHWELWELLRRWGPPLVVPLPSIGTPLWEPPRVGTNRLGAVGWEGDCWDTPGWGPLR